MNMKIHSIGFLSNADSSILKLKLGEGYEICSMSVKEGIALISTYERTEPSRTSWDCSRYINSAEKMMYYISNTFEDNIETNEKGIVINMTCFAKHSRFFQYGKETTHTMRLFKEGDIRMAKSYCYFTKPDGRHRVISYQGNVNTISGINYHLEDSEISELEDFIGKIKLPFELPYLQLAFESFNESYDINNYGLSFLTLMIALEVLFSPDDNKELTYRISRNIAVLLGKTQGESKKIYEDIRELYNKRSKIVHSGKWSSINQKSLLIMREYVRKSIKKISLFGKSKKDLLDLLHTSGFGTNLVKENQDGAGGD